MLTPEHILQLSPRERQRYQAGVIRESGRFDDAYYAVQNPDVMAIGMDRKIERASYEVDGFRCFES